MPFWKKNPPAVQPAGQPPVPAPPLGPVTKDNLIDRLNQNIERFFAERNNHIIHITRGDPKYNNGKAVIEWPEDPHMWSDYLCDLFCEYAYNHIVSVTDLAIVPFLRTLKTNTLNGIEVFLINYSPVYEKLNKLSRLQEQTSEHDYHINGELRPDARFFALKSTLKNVLIFGEFCKTHLARNYTERAEQYAAFAATTSQETLLFMKFNEVIEAFYHTPVKKEHLHILLYPAYVGDQPLNPQRVDKWPPANSHRWTDQLSFDFLRAAFQESLKNGQILKFYSDFLENHRAKGNIRVTEDDFLKEHFALFNQLSLVTAQPPTEAELTRKFFTPDGQFTPHPPFFRVQEALRNVLLFQGFCLKHFPNYVQHVFKLARELVPILLMPEDVLQPVVREPQLVARGRQRVVQTPELFVGIPAHVSQAALQTIGLEVPLGILSREIRIIYNNEIMTKKSFFERMTNKHDNLKDWNDLKCFDFLFRAWKHISETDTVKTINDHLNRAQNSNMHVALIKNNPLYAQLIQIRPPLEAMKYYPNPSDYLAGNFHTHTNIAAIQEALFTILVFKNFCQQFMPQYVSHVIELALKKIQR